MYKFEEKQLSFTDFNQPQGLQMNPENRWIKKAEMIPWDTIEKEYAKLFPSRTGMPAKPLRMALGSLLIQKQYHYPDEELVEQIRESDQKAAAIHPPRSWIYLESAEKQWCCAFRI